MRNLKKRRRLKVIVLPGDLALQYEPTEPTVAIRILDAAGNQKVESLRRTPLYVAVLTYIFDDTHFSGVSRAGCRRIVREEGLKPFNKRIARKIVTDVASLLPHCETLLVHCTAGQSRSPAAAIALMEIFPEIEYAVIMPDALDWLWIDADTDHEVKRFLNPYLKGWMKEGYKRTMLDGMKAIFDYNKDLYEKLLSVGLSLRK